MFPAPPTLLVVAKSTEAMLPVAVVPVPPPPPENATVGAAVYPDPAAVRAIPLTVKFVAFPVPPRPCRRRR